MRPIEKILSIGLRGQGIGKAGTYLTVRASDILVA